MPAGRADRVGPGREDEPAVGSDHSRARDDRAADQEREQAATHATEGYESRERRAGELARRPAERDQPGDDSRVGPSRDRGREAGPRPPQGRDLQAEHQRGHVADGDDQATTNIAGTERRPPGPQSGPSATVAS